MSLDKIAKITKEAAEALNDSKTFITAVLAKKAAYLSEQYPEDITMRGVAQVLSKSSEVLTSRKKLKYLYKGLYSSSTKFASFFRDELDYKEQTENIQTSVISSAPQPFDMFSGVNQELKQTFDQMLGSQVSDVAVSKEAAADAIRRSSAILAQCVPGAKVAVAAGNSQYVVASATYETNRGKTTVYIPLEVKTAGMVDAGVFVGNGVFNLTKQNLSKYLSENVGQPKVSAKSLLDAVKTAGISSEISIPENKMQATAKQVIASKLPEKSAVETYSLQKQFSSEEGMAGLHFGMEKVASAKQMVFSSVKKAGYTPTNVKALSFNKEGLQFGVMLEGNVAFAVPVSIQSGMVKQASLLVSNGTPLPIDKSSITSLYENQDLQMASKASALSSSTTDELTQIVRTAAKSKDFAKAEEALNIIGQTAGKLEYLTAFKVYQDALSGVEAPVCKCSKQITVANSIHKICAHTGLPVNKVVQDKFGNCIPAYHVELEKIQPQNSDAYKAFKG
jgi:hypothetical protein